MARNTTDHSSLCLGFYADIQTITIWQGLFSKEVDFTVLYAGDSAFHLIQAVEVRGVNVVALLQHMHGDPRAGIELWRALRQQVDLLPAGILVSHDLTAGIEVKAVGLNDYVEYESTLCPGWLTKIRAVAHTLPNYTVPCPLTDRLRETLQLLARHRHTTRVANLMNVEEGTIHKYIREIKFRLGLREPSSYHDACRIAIEYRWISDPWNDPNYPKELFEEDALCKPWALPLQLPRAAQPQNHNLRSLRDASETS